VDYFPGTIDNNYNIAFNERGQEEQCEIIVDLVGVKVEEGDEDG